MLLLSFSTIDIFQLGESFASSAAMYVMIAWPNHIIVLEVSTYVLCQSAKERW